MNYKKKSKKKNIDNRNFMYWTGRYISYTFSYKHIFIFIPTKYELKRFVKLSDVYEILMNNSK